MIDWFDLCFPCFLSVWRGVLQNLKLRGQLCVIRCCCFSYRGLLPSSMVANWQASYVNYLRNASFVINCSLAYNCIYIIHHRNPEQNEHPSSQARIWGAQLAGKKISIKCGNFCNWTPFNFSQSWYFKDEVSLDILKTKFKCCIEVETDPLVRHYRTSKIVQFTHEF